MTKETRISIIPNDELHQEFFEFIQKNDNPHLSEQSYLWQFQNEMKRAILCAAFDQNKVICSQTFVPYNLLNENQSFLTAKSENSFLVPEFRGKGIFENTYKLGVGEAQKRKFALIWGFTPAAKVWREKLGFEVFEDVVQNSVCLLKFDSSSNSLTKKIFKKLIQPIQNQTIKRQVRQLKNSSIQDASISISKAIKSDQDLENFQQKQDKELIDLHYSPMFIDWRFYKNPNLEYKSYFCYQKETLVGYAFLSRSEDQKSLYLVDFNFDNENTGRMLLQAIVNELSINDPACQLNYMGNRSNSENQKVFELLRKTFKTREVLNKNMSFVLKQFGEQKYTVNQFRLSFAWTQGYKI